MLATIDQNLDETKFKSAMSDHLDALARQYNVDHYTIIYLLNEDDSLASWHTNRVYKAASSANREKDILLVVHSKGGDIDAGYFIGKTGKRLSKNKFVVAIPRKAKSAATLLAIGADEIHMGLLSELGPIDPQFGGFPAQGIKNALEILSDMACRHPGSAAMLGEYLSKKLDLRILGLFERINESASQYAERLIGNRKLSTGRSAKELADHLVNHYKDHSFVIDHEEATELLGPEIIKHGTSEYDFANAVFESYDLIKFFVSIISSKNIDIVGRADSDIRVTIKKSES